MKKVDIKVNEVIGYNKESNEIYILDTLFEYTDELKGATGTCMMPLTTEQIEEYNTVDYVVERFEDCGVFETLETEELEKLEELFHENNDIEDFDTEDEFYALKEKYIEQHLENSITEEKNERAQTEINYCDGAFPFHDNGGIGKVTENDTEVLETAFDMVIDTYECIGGGRCFNNAIFDDVNFVSLNDELVQEIKNFEDIK